VSSIKNKDEKSNLSIVFFSWCGGSIHLIHGYSGIDGHLSFVYRLEPVLIGYSFRGPQEFRVDLFSEKLLG
jgi:hypothetical protein